MPRVKCDPKKRKFGFASDLVNYGLVDSSGTGDIISPCTTNGSVKKHKKTKPNNALESPLDIRSVKSISTTKLNKHMCQENAEHVLSSFHSYIRIHQNGEFKFHIGHVLVDVNEDFSSDLLKYIYGLYVGDNNISILCLIEDAYGDNVEEKYFISSTCVPTEILSSCAAKFFIVRYAASHSPCTLQFDILLSDDSFSEICFDSEYPKGGKRSSVKKVVEFFCGAEETKNLSAEIQSQSYLSQLFDDIVHEKPFHIDVQHPNLIPQLRPYQSQAVQWMLEREQKQGVPVPETPSIHPLFRELTTQDGIKVYYNKVAGFFSLEPRYAPASCKGGILADEMGLGKTVEVLACILNNPKDDLKVDLAVKHQVHQDSASVKLTSMSSEDTFSCCCGEIYYEESEFNHVKCRMCGVIQHAECFNYFPMSSEEIYYCPHCWVQNSTELVPSGATLIVSPHRISYQWEEEIHKHIQDKSLKILYYQGVSQQNFIQPTVLSEYDIVLTTYEVLKKELNYMDLPYSSRSRSLRRPQKFYCPPSPLSAVLWWRVCLDEAQMAEHATSKIAKMAFELNSVHRWCVTGTPLQKNVNDLYGLFLFLGYDPYCIHTWWKEALYQPFCDGNPDPLIEAFKPVLWRTVKRNVLDQINIPRQTMVMEWVKFSPVEEYFYNEQAQKCTLNLYSHLNSIDVNVQLKSLHKDFLREVWVPVRELRQACCHPQVVKGQFASVQKSFLSMNEVLDTLIKKAQYKAADAHRQFIAVLHGLAGIHIVSENTNEAINCYKKVLSSAHQHSENFKTDSFQLYHALYNLGDILTDQKIRPLHHETEEHTEDNEPREQEVVEHPLITEPLSKAKIRTEAENIKASYLGKTATAIESAVQHFHTVSQEANSQSTVITSKQPWWIRICDCAVRLHKDDEFLEKLRNDLLGAVYPGKPSIGYRFRDVSGLCFLIYNLLIALNTSRDDLKKSVMSLPHVPSNDDVTSAAACHLRPDTRMKTRIFWCQYCRANRQFDVYESKLFHCVGRKTQEQHQENSKQCYPRDNRADSSDSLQHSSAGTQGIWADSELERVFKALLTFGTRNQVEISVLDNGVDTLLWISTLKKEFKALRNLWLKLSDHVSAIDEINMVSQRIRLRRPDEIPEDPPLPCILQEDQVESVKQKMLSDEPVFHSKLKETIFKLCYLKNLRKLENEKTGNENAKICPVCHQQLKAMWTVLPCGHCLCSDCVLHLMKEYPIPNHPTYFRCPVCREETCNQDVFYIGNETKSPLDKEFPVEGSYSSKVTAVVRCLLKLKKEDPSAKSIIFSEWLDLLDIIASALQKNKISFVSLRSKKTFQDDLKQFKSESTINTALLNINSCSSGLNIIEATHVLLVAPQLHSSWEMQAIGRVHRIGQTRKTIIHRFIVKDSIEEKVYNLLPIGCQSDDEIKSKESSLTLKDLQELF